MSTLEDIRSKAVKVTRESSGKLSDPEDFDRLVEAALSEYSRHRPNTKAADIQGNGTHDYAVSALTGWVEGFSAVRRIEYPIDEVPESLLDDDKFYIFEKPAGKVLRLRDNAPSASETFRVTFTIPRTATTVPDNDVSAVANLAAAYACEELANAYAPTGDSTVGADSVDHRSKSQEYASRARRLKALYKEHLGIKEGDSVPPASAVSGVDVGYPGGGDRLTHPRSLRRRR